ncbi:MAG: carotenoid biosynthesis protein [Labilithrix sp.]|nr:carotenoid biosynthesis protein [Labilithrix sp.]
MSMPILELVCLAIVAIYVVARLVRARAGAERRAFVLRFGALAIAAAVGENSMIRAYGAYAYARSWSLFVDQVPVVVVLVWPVVIDSAATLARRVIARGTDETGAVARTALLTAAIVFADASLIEPIAVLAGLWSWTEPGLFEVPLVGIAGWAMFAGAATAVLERGAATAVLERGAPERSGRLGPALGTYALTILLAPAVAHALVLASWWGLFRWTQGSIAPATGIAVAWIVLGAATIAAFRLGRRVPLADVLLRAPGAAFFFGLLAIVGASDGTHGLLFFYALAFAPPYLAAMASRVAVGDRGAAGIGALAKR